MFFFIFNCVDYKLNTFQMSIIHPKTRTYTNLYKCYLAFDNAKMVRTKNQNDAVRTAVSQLLFLDFGYTIDPKMML